MRRGPVPPRPAPAAPLADLLQGVHRDLTTFTTALAAWAARHTSDGPALTATIDTAFAFTAPLVPSAT